MRTRIEMRIGVVALVAFALATAGPARAQDTGEHWTCTPVAELFHNDCTGEDVFLTGQLCVSTTTVLDQSGGSHSVTFAKLTLRGVGVTTGARYVLDVQNKNVSNANGNNPQDEITIVINEQFISQGPLDNLFISLFARITINANGELATDQFKFAIECRG